MSTKSEIAFEGGRPYDEPAKPQNSKRYTFVFKGGPASLMDDDVMGDEVIASSRVKAYEILGNCYNPTEVARAKIVKIEKVRLFEAKLETNPVGHVNDVAAIKVTGLGKRED